MVDLCRWTTTCNGSGGRTTAKSFRKSRGPRGRHRLVAPRSPSAPPKGKPVEDTDFEDETDTDEGTPPPKKGKKGPTVIDEMNAKHAMVYMGGKAMVVTFGENGSLSMGAPYHLEALYSNIKHMPAKGTIPITRAKYWMDHPLRPTYWGGIVFAPVALR
jgi:hypothetical protein